MRRTAPSRANIGVARRTSAQGKRRSAGCNLQREAVQRTRPIVRVCPINPILSQIVPMNARQLRKVKLFGVGGCCGKDAWRLFPGLPHWLLQPGDAPWVVTKYELVTGSPRPSPRFRLGTGEVPRWVPLSIRPGSVWQGMRLLANSDADRCFHDAGKVGVPAYVCLVCLSQSFVSLCLPHGPTGSPPVSC